MLDAAARVHVLYLETAEDQRGADGSRSAGCHLNSSGRGPTLCSGCGGVADVWRGRLDNMQCALRMCCAEGAIFRPFVKEFALVSPRVALRYELARFGEWMAREGTKRATEAVVVGAALRAAAAELSSESGVTHAALDCTEAGAGEAMWRWVQAWVAAVRAGSGGRRVVSLLLDAGAPPLVSSTAAGALAAHVNSSATPVRDVIILVGGPSGVPRSWRDRLTQAVGRPLLKVSLRGGVQHSAPALAELLMLHERGDLMPLLDDRLALTAEQHKAWRRAEREVVHAWLRQLGLHGDGNTADGGAVGGDPVAGLLEAHRALLQRLTAMGAPAAMGASTGGAMGAPAGGAMNAAAVGPLPPHVPSKKGKNKKKRPRPEGATPR